MELRRGHRVEVTVGAGGRPAAFRRQGRWVRIVEVLDEWEETGRWWLGEEPRAVHRVLAAGGAAYELHHQPSSGWQLHRAFD